MPRPQLTPRQKQLGRALGAEIQRRRGSASAASLAVASGINLDTWRRVEQGEVAAPGLFLVADMARALRVTLDELVDTARVHVDEVAGA